MIMRRTPWDVLVIGAGPAGAVAAYQLARAGLDVLLVDKAAFPRLKVCGGCVNAAAMLALQQIGMGDLLPRLGAHPTTRFDLIVADRVTTLALRGGFAVSRAAFDLALVQQAINRGATFHDHTHATLQACDDGLRHVLLHDADGQRTVRARVVLAADGLGGRLLAEETASKVSGHSRMGLGAVLPAEAGEIAPGVVAMHLARHGYVGHVRLEDGRINLAAAVDPAWLKACGGPGDAVGRIMGGAHFPLDLRDIQWHGTPLLSRRHGLYAHRVLALGDAGGYVEPFTGQGMAWAIASALAVSPIAAQAARHWDANVGPTWSRVYHRRIVRQQRWCHLISRLLRHPRLMGMMMRIAAHRPMLLEAVARKIDALGQVRPQVETSP